ncbi:Protein of unknown function [Fontimonas thermophila]|uniref:DUF1329 domain-containing protein n=1 Tax=Fontimonas thermophila TaxID=1076937 RepID=A0A1I2JTL1_9GAMM|nr:DUF1329 domain-containing protein [Fontimonas thermophila]SFF57280.1 Protein of unknown function [Fontimonas thermophila]
MPIGHVRAVRWAAVGWCLAHAAMAPPSAAQPAAPEDPERTCLGAERAGTADGVATYTGRWVGHWPGLQQAHGYTPGPYADEKPVLTITAQNMAQHADRLTEGQKALFKAYPDHFRMRIYPSHRDFGVPDWVCAAARHNAQHATLGDEGLSVRGAVGGAPAFPFPRDGLEAIRSVQTAYRAWTEKAEFDVATVYPGGQIAWGRYRLMTMSPMHKPGPQRPSLSERIGTYFYAAMLLPERDRGRVSVGFQANNFTEGSTHAWEYQPGTRRVRQAPEVGFDYPVPPTGMHTSDEDGGFNGSPERYQWTLVGKKALYVPYHNFRINDPALTYRELLTPYTLNPELLRYELHRVWIVEATLKPGMRHIYARRRLYIDEDSWQVLTADHYDARGSLWRIPVSLSFYAQEAAAFHRGVQIFHDLDARAYEAINLVNERGAENGWRFNTPMNPAMFAPEAAARPLR